MISTEELRKLAILARIDMPDNELEELRGQLDEILGFVAQVQNADVSSVPELAVPELHNVFRDDGEAHSAGIYTEAIMANAPVSERGYFKVKKILENK